MWVRLPLYVYGYVENWYIGEFQKFLALWIRIPPYPLLSTYTKKDIQNYIENTVTGDKLASKAGDG